MALRPRPGPSGAGTLVGGLLGFWCMGLERRTHRYRRRGSSGRSHWDGRCRGGGGVRTRAGRWLRVACMGSWAQTLAGMTTEPAAAAEAGRGRRSGPVLCAYACALHRRARAQTNLGGGCSQGLVAAPPAGRGGRDRQPESVCAELQEEEGLIRRGAGTRIPGTRTLCAPPHMSHHGWNRPSHQRRGIGSRLRSAHLID